MTENTKICRICLDLFDNGIYIDLDDVKLEMLKIVSPLSGVQLSIKSVLCNNCSDSLQQSINFKTTCLNNEVHLKTFQCDNGKLVLTEIIHKVKETENVVKREDESICRLCFGYFDSYFFTDLYRIEDDFFLREMIDKCLPEIDLNSTDHPVMCHNCLQSLQNQFNIISTLLDTNDKINDYISYKNNKDNVNLRNVLEFTTGVKRENESSITKFSTKEEEEIFEDVEKPETYIKMEEDIFLKEEPEYTFVDGIEPSDGQFVKGEAKKKVKINEQALKKNSRGMFACPYCQHETTRKDSLFLHLLTHQESPVFSCDKCEFVTKWRTSLNQHAWLHEETTLYQCPNCPYKSRYSKHVRRHNKRHGKTKPLTSLRCQYCNFTTADRNYFKLHNKSKHKKEVIFDKSKTFRCVQCDFETCKKCLLTKHCNEEHKRHVCECCGFQANTLWHLNDHKLKHMKEEEVAMFRCAQCEFSTKYKNSLKAHLRRHDSCRRKK